MANKNLPAYSRALSATYKDIEAFLEACETEDLLVYEALLDVFEPKDLICEGMGLRCEFRDPYLDGSADVFRPFPGVALLIVSAQWESNAKPLTLSPSRTDPSPSFFHAVLAGEGTSRIEVGEHQAKVLQGSGIVISTRKRISFLPPQTDGGFQQSVHVLMTRTGISNASARMAIPTLHSLSTLNTHVDDHTVLLKFPQSEDLIGFISSVMNGNVPDTMKEAFFRAKIAELFCYLAAAGFPAPTADKDLSQFEITRLEKAKQLLDRNIGGKNGLGSIARHVGLGQTRLSTGFQALYGVSISEYKMELRLSRAMELLTKTNLRVEQIAEMCGYSTNGNFSRSFKRRFGINPTAARKL